MIKRNYSDVLNSIIELIPVTSVKNIDFIDDLKWNLEDGFYKAPEDTIHWKRLSKTLQKHISHPTEEWEFKILSIVTTKPIDELKEMIRNENI